MSTSSASSGAPGVFTDDAVESVTEQHNGKQHDGNGRVPARGARAPARAARTRRDTGHAEKTEQSGGVEEANAPELVKGPVSLSGEAPNVAATSSVSAEAQQGDGPAAAGASASGVAHGIARTSSVSVVIGPYGAAAACDAGVVVSGPHGSAAASEAGVSAVGANGAASSSNAANATSAAVEGAHEPGRGDLLDRLAQLEEQARELRQKLT